MITVYKPQALLFDFDGVIMDSVKIKTEAFKEVFKEYPQHLDEIAKYHEINGGLSRFEKFKYIYTTIIKKPELATEDHLFNLGGKFSQFALDKILTMPLNDGFEELAETLLVKDIPAYIVSGTPHEEINFIVASRNLSKYFKGVYGSPAKKGEIIRKTIEHNHFNPKHLYFIGDSINDLAGAQEAGVHFIGFNLEGDHPKISSFREIQLSF